MTGAAMASVSPRKSILPSKNSASKAGVGNAAVGTKVPSHSFPASSGVGQRQQSLLSMYEAEVLPGQQINWIVQFAVLLSSLVGYCFFIISNHSDPNSSVCHSEPYDPWIKPYILPVLGASIGQTLSLFFRIILSTQGFSSEGRLRHPNATKLILLISLIQSVSFLMFYTDVIPFTCADFLGVKTPVFIWFEWSCTVPFLFFLIAIMDVKRTQMKNSDLVIEIMGGLSIYQLAFGVLPLPNLLHWFNFISSNVLMTVALVWQQLNAYEEYSYAMEECRNAAQRAHPSSELVDRDIHDRLCVAQCKMNSSIFMSLFFTIFPVLYYLQCFGYMSQEMFIVTTYVCSFLAKCLFIHIIADSHVEILDPNKFLLMEERKKAEDSRLMFLRYVFHEVRVPLNSLVLGLQILLDNDMVTSQEPETLNLMREATTFMAETLNDVLSLQKIEQGMLQLEYKPFSVDHLVQSVLSNFKAQSESKRLHVSYVLDPNVPAKVLGDEFRLEHVLGNLLSNAIKFSDPDTKIGVRVSYGTKLSNHVTFSVTDQGPGMSAEDQKHLFQPFMQIRPGELQKGRGSGLGLSICKTIVALHNGTISCTSKQRVGDDISSGGSDFFFNIEFAEVEEEEEEADNEAVDRLVAGKAASSGSLNTASSPTTVAETTAVAADADASQDRRRIVEDDNYIAVPRERHLERSKSGTEASSSTDDIPVHPAAYVNPKVEQQVEAALSSKTYQIGKILVCDDVLSNRKMLEMILKRKGFTCEQCSDGVEAIALVEEKGLDYFDIIFMDSIMPVMCGPEASRKLRLMGFNKLLIGVTGNAMDIDIIAYEQAGADLILTKPMRIESLNKVLEFCALFGCQSHFIDGLDVDHVPYEHQDRKLKKWILNNFQ